MNPKIPRIVIASILILTEGLASPVEAIAPEACAKVLAAPQNGSIALNNLKSNVAAVASLNGKSEASFRALLLGDSSYWLDECGYAFYVDQAPKNVSSSPTISAAPFAYDQTFKLHSKPGSTKTIYLDFTGYTFSNAWNSGLGVPSPYTASGYSQDLDFSTFTTAEQDVIQSVWQRVSEDYAPFDVDVTTEEPALGVLERSSLSDTVYGTRAAITADSTMQASCKCGGVAYVGVFDLTGSNHEYYQPAWVFTKGVGTGAKNIAEAVSHEVGHNLGLDHDGTSTQGYYSGAAGWAPIMGVGYYEGLTQWSKGEYPGANNKQDDYSVMASNGVLFRVDEDSSTSSSARTLTSSSTGIISTPTDSDWYTFTTASSGNVTLSATVAAVSPNLDVRLDLYVSSDLNTPIATSNPSMVDISTDIIGALNASITYSVTSGLTYLVKIDGVGFGDPAVTGYTDYGSLGAYSLQLSGLDNGYTISSASFAPINSSVTTGYGEIATATTLTLNRAGTSGANPAGLISVNAGTWNIGSAINIVASPTSISSTSGSTLTLTSTSGNLALSLAAGSPAGTYTATVTSGSQTLATYSVTVQGTLPATIGGLACTRIAKKNSASCTWSPLSPTPTRYEYRLRDISKNWPATWSSTTSNSVSVGGIRSGSTYEFQVRAVNSAGAGPITTSSRF